MGQSCIWRNRKVPAPSADPEAAPFNEVGEPRIQAASGTNPDTDTLILKGGARTGTDPTEMVAPPDGRLHGLDSVHVADACRR